MEILNMRFIGAEEKNSADNIYVGRGSRWGNPYIIGRDGNRKEVIELYKIWLEINLNDDPDFLEPLRYKKGFICYCAPLDCHANVLANFLER